MGGQKEQVVCHSCGASSVYEFTCSVNLDNGPELKEDILNGKPFIWNCPSCGATNLRNGPFLYHDPKSRLMIVMTSSGLRGEGLPEGYTGRIVRSTGELIEKIKIFDAGLDDTVIETCKYVSCHEMGREMNLKFFKLDGADSELTFTYPEDGRMEMIAVGFRVYEDCAAIINRNPRIKEAANGLVTVDQDWLSQFFA